eukprot:TRINITY_DN1296_c0_g1_i1.p6 TRINITY_DN1296_c0_g1~~TRINITY_DN1296_c0_g1_i1.p6  ORF type:complete len:308 (+),score=52.80 TRINITY_DN1296_c0_g1_i1:3203-4126(+)
MIKSQNDGLKYNIQEFFKVLLDPESKELKDDFFDVFYDSLLDTLSPALEIPISQPTLQRDLGFDLAIGLLSYCAKLHGYKMRYYLLQSGILPEVFRLLRHNGKEIRLSSLQFVKTLVQNKDETLMKHIVKNNLFEYVMGLLRTVKREGMIMACLRELFDFIEKQNVNTLITHIVEKHAMYLEEELFIRMGVFKRIKEKYVKLRQGPKGEEIKMDLAKKRESPEKAREMKFSDTEEEEKKFSDTEEEEETRKKKKKEMENDTIKIYLPTDGQLSINWLDNKQISAHTVFMINNELLWIKYKPQIAIVA